MILCVGFSAGSASGHVFLNNFLKTFPIVVWSDAEVGFSGTQVSGYRDLMMVVKEVFTKFSLGYTKPAFEMQ